MVVYAKSVRGERRLTDDQVVYILESRESSQKLASKLGVSRQTISYIRSGKNYKTVRPDLPRIGGIPVSCTSCLHSYRTKIAVPRNAATAKTSRTNAREVWVCSLGFPDIREEGVWFARDCAAYAAESEEGAGASAHDN